MYKNSEYNNLVNKSYFKKLKVINSSEVDHGYELYNTIERLNKIQKMLVNFQKHLNK